MLMNTLKYLGLVLLSILLLVVACVADSGSGIEVELRNTQKAHIEVIMGAGKLTLDDTAEKLLEGSFTYSVASWKPQMDYSANGGLTTVILRQPTTTDIMHLGNARNDWNLHLNRDLPLELDMIQGAGNSTLDLGSLNLIHLNVTTGAGNATVDLSGLRDRDLNVNIQGGVGNLTLRLPRQVGAVVDAKGIGGLYDVGLIQQNGVYKNHAYGHSEGTVTVHILGGVGTVRLTVGE